MFRSLTIYQLTQTTDRVLEKLQTALEEKPFEPCGEHFQSSHGFVPPLGGSTQELTYETDGGILFCLRIDAKQMPAAVVKLRTNELAAKRVADGETMSKGLLRDIREGVEYDLLPDLIPVPTWSYAYVDRTLGMLFVGAGEDDADHFLQLLRAAMDAGPFALLNTDADPCIAYTKWLRECGDDDCDDPLDGRFTIGHDCSLKHPRDGGTANISVRTDDLDGPEWLAMLDAGKQVCRIALDHDAMTFAVTAKVGIRSMKLADRLREDIDDDAEPHAFRAAEFAAYVRAVRSVMRDLEKVLGGWPTQELLDLHGTQSDEANT